MNLALWLVLFTGLASSSFLSARETLPAPAEVESEEAPPEFRRINAEEKQEVKNGLEPVWEGYQSDVATAEIEYLSLIFSIKTRELTCEQFEEELGQISLVADETLTRRLVEKFCPEQLTGKPEKDERVLNAIGDWRTFVHQENNRRCVSKVFEHVMVDDLHLMADHPNRGIRAYRRGGGEYWFETMDWFRTAPNVPLFDVSDLATDDALFYRLEYYGPTKSDQEKKYASWLTLGQDDGLPRVWKMHAPQTGTILRLERFQDYTVYPGDVICPAVRMKVSFENDKVARVRMSVIRKARFNHALAEDAFTMTAPVNWAWFDWQEEERKGGRWHQPVSDVAEFFRRRTASTVTREDSHSNQVRLFGWRPLLMILNGSLLIGIGIALWRRSA